MRKLGWVLLLVALMLAGRESVCARAGDLNILTYADFTRVRYVANSLNSVYFATTEGIIRYNKAQGQWDDPLTGTLGIDDRDIRRIWVDEFDQKLYAQTSIGTYEYDLLFEEWYSVSDVPNIDTRGRHIGPPPVIFTPPGFTYTSEGHLQDEYGRSFYLNDILDDGSGNLWIGTWGYGAATAGSASGVLEFLPFGLIQNAVNAIYLDGDMLWVGGSSRGAYRTGVTGVNLDDNSAVHIESGLGRGFPSADVNCLASDESYLYVGTTEGLYLYDRHTEKIERAFDGRHGLGDDNVLSLKTVGDSVFVGTENGLSLLAFGGDSVRYIRPQQFFNTVIYDLETTDSSLWIGSSVGAYQLIFQTGKLQKFLDPNSIAFNRVYNIDRFENELWLASDGGMVRLNLETAETTPYVSITGGFAYRAMAVSYDIAALASSRGVTIFFLDDDNAASEREFGVNDGLPSADIRALLVDGDYLWIGSDRGLTRFLWNDPDRVD